MMASGEELDPAEVERFCEGARELFMMMSGPDGSVITPSGRCRVREGRPGSSGWALQSDAGDDGGMPASCAVSLPRWNWPGEPEPNPRRPPRPGCPQSGPSPPLSCIA